MPEPIMLAEPETRASFQSRLRASENLAHLAARLDALAPEADPNELMGHVLGTRDGGREFVAAHPKAPRDVVLDAQWVEVITTPFLQELLKAWPDAQVVNANEDVAETVAFVRERLRDV